MRGPMDGFIIRLNKRQHEQLMRDCSGKDQEEIPTHAFVSQRTGVERDDANPLTIISSSTTSSEQDRATSYSFSSPHSMNAVGRVKILHPFKLHPPHVFKKVGDEKSAESGDGAIVTAAGTMASVPPSSTTASAINTTTHGCGW